MGGVTGPGGGGGNDKTEFGYTKPKNPLKKPLGLALGFYDALKKGAASNKKKKKEAKINDTLLGTPDYQGDVKAPPTISEVLAEKAAKDQRDRDPNPNPSDYKGTVLAANVNTQAPTNAEITQAQSTDMSADQILVANKKKGKTKTILNTAQGLGGSSLNTTKKTLGA